MLVAFVAPKVAVPSFVSVTVTAALPVVWEVEKPTDAGQGLVLSALLKLFPKVPTVVLFTKVPVYAVPEPVQVAEPVVPTL
jgi:hypothetical protein